MENSFTLPHVVVVMIVAFVLVKLVRGVFRLLK